tara:strand:+ start:1567 stop:2298 length:732 start_codon:yes stop_codon:yes gene_type:complete
MHIHQRFVFIRKIINSFFFPTFLYSKIIKNHSSPDKVILKNNLLIKIFLKIFYFYPRYLHDSVGWIEASENSYRNINDFKHLRIGIDDVFLEKIIEISKTNDAILDLGCGIGRHLNYLKKNSYNNLHGVDIMRSTKLNYFDLSGINLHTCFLQEYLINNKKKYDIIYSVGAVIELVHPSFDIVKYMCRASNKFICLLLQPDMHYFPRFYIYEFRRNGFRLFSEQKNLNNSKIEQIDMLFFRKM